MSATRALLGELVDDAGLFPPARLSMEDALAAHVRAQAGEAYWVQGRFVVAASRLSELRSKLDDSPDPLPTSVVLDGEPAAALEAVAHEVQRRERTSVESLEIRATHIAPGGASDEFGAFVDTCERIGLPAALPVYVEIAPGADPRVLVENLRAASSGARALFAKVRCGGETAEARPDAGWLADFIAAAREGELPFKATAGLHHPIAHHNAAAGFAMHGFLNVIGGAVLLYAGVLDRRGLETMLRDEDARHFRLDADRFGWNDTAADAGAIGAARAAFVHSFGSCSFDEPIDDLCALGMLGTADAA